VQCYRLTLVKQESTLLPFWYVHVCTCSKDVFMRERERERRWKEGNHTALCGPHKYLIVCTYILHTLVSPMNISIAEPGAYLFALMRSAFIYCSTDKLQFAITGNNIMYGSYRSIHGNMHLLIIYLSKLLKFISLIIIIVTMLKDHICLLLLSLIFIIPDHLTCQSCITV